MSSPNERRTRAGYDLFLAADPDNQSHWDPTSPLAAVMHEEIQWFDDDDGNPVQPSPTHSGITDVLGRLRELRREMLTCEILSCSEAGGLVHTLDHAVKVDQAFYRETRPHLCASSFEFDDRGKVKMVRYCSRQVQLHVRVPPESAS